MLRRAENVKVFHKPSFFTGKGYVTVQVGRESYSLKEKIHKDDWARRRHEQRSFPVLLLDAGERRYWQFQDRYYWENDRLSADEIYALLVTKQAREKQRIERAQAIVAAERMPVSRSRIAIPDDVKQLVWVRDKGHCQRCGSTVELQYDHIVPVSMGGSSEPENLQILCGPCNRRKGASLTAG